MELREVEMVTGNNQFSYKIITRAGSEVGHGFMNLKHALVSLRNLRQTGVNDAIVVNFKTVVGRKKSIQKVTLSNPKHKRIYSTNTSASERPVKK
jgi:hypothetical protein